MLVGLPYSGKSFLAKSLGLYNGNYTVISSDLMVQGYAESVGKTYNDVFKDYIEQAQKDAVSLMQDSLRLKKDIVIDQTNLTISSRKRKLSQVSKEYEKICIVVPQPSDEELELRKATRTSHIIPEEALRQMKSIYQQPTLEEGFDSIYIAGFDDIVLTKDKSNG